MPIQSPDAPDGSDSRPSGAPSDRLMRGLTLGAVAIGTIVVVWALALGRVEHVDRPLPGLPATIVGTGAALAVTDGAPTVLHVWLPGCGACAAEAAAYEEVRVRYAAEGVRFVSVSVLPDAPATRRAATAYGLGGTLATTNGNLMEALQLGEVPSTVWISGEGRVVAVGSGALSERVLDRETRDLLH